MIFLIKLFGSSECDNSATGIAQRQYGLTLLISVSLCEIYAVQIVKFYPSHWLTDTPGAQNTLNLILGGLSVAFDAAVGCIFASYAFCDRTRISR